MPRSKLVPLALAAALLLPGRTTAQDAFGAVEPELGEALAADGGVEGACRAAVLREDLGAGRRSGAVDGRWAAQSQPQFREQSHE